MKSLLAGLIGIAVGVGGGWMLHEHFAPAIIINPDAIQEVEVKGKIDEGGFAKINETSSPNPAYLVVLGDVYDREAFMTGYAGKLGDLYEKYGGEYIAVGQNKDILENGNEFQSFVISKWPSMEAAQNFWNDPEYVKLKDERIEKNWSRFDVYLLEGL